MAPKPLGIRKLSGGIRTVASVAALAVGVAFLIYVRLFCR